MTRVLNRLAAFPALLAVMLALGACNKKEETPVSQGPPGGVPGGRGPGFGPGTGGPPSPIGQIMAKLTKGPESLTPLIGAELKADPPPWDQIQAQTREYAELAASMVKHDPPKGSKESWEKFASAFAGSAAALEKAAQAKDKDAAVAAHKSLSSSCMGCHQQHRAGPGGFGPPGKGFGPPGKDGGFPPPGKDAGTSPPPKDGGPSSNGKAGPADPAPP